MPDMKPILFNTEMVRAILDGRKTVTRRVLKGEAQQAATDFVRRYSEDLDTSELIPHWWVDTPLEYYVTYRPGDILYVRETWATWSRTEGLAPTIHYKADGETLPNVKWRPSTTMPREAARIWLRVTDVRVERLQEIDGAGIYAEGTDGKHGFGATRGAFAQLWDSTIKPADRERYGWAANPWVWVIAFERCDAPPQRGVQSATGQSPALSAEQKPEEG